MAEKESTSETDGTLTMPRHQRYYALHREQELARDWNETLTRRDDTG